ncbi:hypothetical protein LTR53_004864 [Teratosphaeriaceae sp. CCFEE 6253]|nr:hypothetical protein LTR53_004864 [Teratosphaeriaceae sp. CCFEE 6253]
MASTYALPERRPPAHDHQDSLHSPPPSEQRTMPGYEHDLQLQDIDSWERENPRVEKQTLSPIQAVKANPEHLIKFHTACQDRGITPIFDFSEPTPYRFRATVVFGGETVECDGDFPSKKLAKEDVCKRAINLVEQISPGSKKRKTPENDGGDDDRVSDEILNSANWIATLQNYTQSHRLTMPDYTELRTPLPPHLFACVVKTSTGPPGGFGSSTDLYSTKQAAKKAAAREAVLWLRARGIVLTEAKITGGPPSPKRRKSTEVDTVELPGATGLIQALHKVEVSDAAPQSLAQQVHDLVASLGLSQPAWKTKPSASRGPPFIDMAAEFMPIDVQKDPRLAGEVGKVKGLLGKKPAKERCCHDVLRVLEDIKRSRSA